MSLPGCSRPTVLARQIKFHDLERLTDPGVRTLIEEAAKRTPRA